MYYCWLLRVLVATAWRQLRSSGCRLGQCFNWVGLTSATAWGWQWTVPMGYVGQGMIMGCYYAIEKRPKRVGKWYGEGNNGRRVQL